MSLTSIIKDINNQELRDKFKIDFPIPEINLNFDLLAPPLTNNYGIIGTAFDYLMRFYLQFHNNSIINQKSEWVADSAYGSLISLLGQSTKKEIKTGFRKDKIFNTKNLLNLLIEQYSQAKINYDNYILNGMITEELVSSTLFLAKLDLYYRNGVIDNSFDYNDPEDIKDITSLICLVDHKKFTAKEKCYLNPTFGKGSILVGGADADLIIDNTLIDIKATKHLKVERVYFNQVLGYYILSLIGGVNNDKLNKPIENLGFYFARHGLLWTIPISELGDNHKFENFKDWFVSYVSEKKLT